MRESNKEWKNKKGTKLNSKKRMMMRRYLGVLYSYDSEVSVSGNFTLRSGGKFIGDETAIKMGKRIVDDDVNIIKIRIPIKGDPSKYNYRQRKMHNKRMKR